MRALAVGLSLALACGSTAERVEPVTMKPVPVEPPPKLPTKLPTKLQLVEGTPATLDDGTSVSARGIMYAHLTRSRNLSSCTLVVSRGADSIEIGLAREHGDPTAKVASADALGWRFTLELADPYQQPSRVVVEAQPVP